MPEKVLEEGLIGKRIMGKLYRKKHDGVMNEQNSKRMNKAGLLKKTASIAALFAMAVCVMWVSGFTAFAKRRLPTGDMKYFPEVENLGEIEFDDENLSSIKTFKLNANLVTGPHYSRLSSDEKLLYEVFYNAISDGMYISYSDRANAASESVSAAKAIKFYTGTNSFMNQYTGKGFDYALNRAIEAVCYDNPDRVEFYMVFPYQTWSSVNSDGTISDYITLLAQSDDTQFATYDSQIQNSLNSIVTNIKAYAHELGNDNWDAVLELAAHDYYCTDYDLTYDDGCAEETDVEDAYFDYAHTAYGALVQKSAVCDGYSCGFRLIMEKLNVDTMVVTGDAGGGHAWNIVELDGNWYEIDTTWDDGATGSESEAAHYFFNKTTEQFATSLVGTSAPHQRTPNIGYLGFRLPVARGKHWNYSYIVENTNYIHDPDSGYSINMQDSLTMKIGATATLTATVEPAGAGYTLSSSDTSVVSVSGNTLTGLAEGTAIITATCTADPEVTATCAVTVERIAVTGISIPETLELVCDETAEITATIEPSDATYKDYMLSSSDSNVVLVDGTTIKGVSAGTATITATTADGGLTDTCVVTVKEKTVSVTGITIKDDSREIFKGDTIEINATIAPENATNQGYTLTSSDEKVAKVDGLTVKGLNPGIANITATTADGAYKASCIVYVYLNKKSTFKKSGVTYKVTKKGEVSIVGCTIKNLNIRDKVDNKRVSYKVTAIDKKALYKNKNLYSVKGGKNISKIGDYAFMGCPKLKKVNLLTAGNLKKIGKYAFYNCNKLSKLEFAVNNKGNYPTFGKKALKKISNSAKITIKADNEEKYKKAKKRAQSAGASTAKYTWKKK